MMPPVLQDDSADVRASRAILWTGVYTGALLVVVMLAALVAANRIPALERYALERNAAFGGVFVLVMLLPILRFLKRPKAMFASAMFAWVMFVAGYDLAGLYFRSLFDVLRTPFQALVEGAVVYGVIAGAFWVAGMALHARRHPILPGRRVSRDAEHHTR